MDRNVLYHLWPRLSKVATREGGVDRNSSAMYKQQCQAVATREGGVDRNIVIARKNGKTLLSPPARVAWIETLNQAAKNCEDAGRHPRGWRG